MENGPSPSARRQNNPWGGKIIPGRALRESCEEGKLPTSKEKKRKKGFSIAASGLSPMEGNEAGWGRGQVGAMVSGQFFGEAKGGDAHLLRDNQRR